MALHDRIIQGDCLEVLKMLPDECVDCIVTSPPYYGLRDYGIQGQIGLEAGLEEYLDKMLAITVELRRVLKSTGTMWWNHGDSYNGSGKAGQGKNALYRHTEFGTESDPRRHGRPMNLREYPRKSLLLQAHRLVIRMIDEQGWLLRNQIIWHKPNCMPSSATDRFTVDYEPVFFFAKSMKYWFEQQFEPRSTLAADDVDRILRHRTTERSKGRPGGVSTYTNRRSEEEIRARAEMGRTRRSVWKMSTKPFKEAHFATFPPDLIEIPIRAGCPEFICNACDQPRAKAFDSMLVDVRPHRLHQGAVYETVNKPNGQNRYHMVSGFARTGIEGKRVHVFHGYSDCGCNAGWHSGIVLDPFMGSGTTAAVASALGRHYLGVELNPEYIRITRRRLGKKGSCSSESGGFSRCSPLAGCPPEVSAGRR